VFTFQFNFLHSIKLFKYVRALIIFFEFTDTFCSCRGPQISKLQVDVMAPRFRWTHSYIILNIYVKWFDFKASQVKNKIFPVQITRFFFNEFKLNLWIIMNSGRLLLIWNLKTYDISFKNNKFPSILRVPGFYKSSNLQKKRFFFYWKKRTKIFHIDKIIKEIISILNFVFHIFLNLKQHDEIIM